VSFFSANAVGRRQMVMVI